MQTSLTSKRCAACEGLVSKLSNEDAKKLLAEVPGWQIVNNHHLSRSFKFRDFMSALGLVNKAAAIAEEEGHHPDIGLSWGKAKFDIYTHAVDGLTENDFILAAKIQQAAEGEAPH